MVILTGLERAMMCLSLEIALAPIRLYFRLQVRNSENQHKMGGKCIALIKRLGLADDIT